MDNQIPKPQAPQPTPVPPPVQPAPQPIAQPQPVPAPTPVSQPVFQPAPQPQPVPQTPIAPPVEVIPPPIEVEAPVAAEYSPVEQPVAAVPEATITWSAQEYIHPDKTPIWYFLFGFVALALIAVDVFLLQSWTFSALVVVMTVATIVYIRRPARTLTYALSSAEGLYVGEQLHSFDDFKSFGLIKDDGENSIMLVPRKRFAPGVSVYFPEEVGEQLVDILGSRLPMEELKLDIFDVIIRKLRL